MVPASEVINGDCMDYLKDYPDNYFSLSLVDPQYGIGSSRPTEKSNKVKQKNGTILNISQPNYSKKSWDDFPPSDEYFKELLRVSKNQIIWGCNYFNFPLSGGRIIWDKVNDYSDQYDGEIAFQSFNKRVDIVRYMWAGMMQGRFPSDKLIISLEQQGNKKLNEKRIHPTQKPIILYKWLLKNYAKEGDTILDTHLGSQSSRIAAHDMGFNFTGYEIDKDYFDAGEKRFQNHIQQGSIFKPNEMYL